MDSAHPTGEIVGLYILHPNNIGRCGHIANASFAVGASHRGLHIGDALVRYCLVRVRELGFRILQFNAVVCTNAAAIRLYERLGFHPLGTIPGGFRNADGQYLDIRLYYKEL
jgi:ribosomal protein S18 acetylase RimI-like enzyme